MRSRRRNRPSAEQQRVVVELLVPRLLEQLQQIGHVEPATLVAGHAFQIRQIWHLNSLSSIQFFPMSYRLETI